MKSKVIISTKWQHELKKWQMDKKCGTLEVYSLKKHCFSLLLFRVSIMRDFRMVFLTNFFFRGFRVFSGGFRVFSGGLRVFAPVFACLRLFSRVCACFRLLDMP